MNTLINIASFQAINHKFIVFHFSVIDTYHIFCLKHLILTIQLKKLNEAWELIFDMHAHIRIISTHAKDQRSSFFHFHIINKCHFLWFELCFLTVQPKNRTGTICYFRVDSYGSGQYPCQKGVIV